LNAQRVAWFWPLSFLAALGQLLLLVTDNRGGPATARFLLAVWTLWLPGAGLGNLLTKSETRLPARLAVEASCALAVAYLVLLLRGAGWVGPAFAAHAIAGIALLASLLFLILSADRRSRRRKTRGHGPGPEESLATSGAVFVLVSLAAVQLWAGSPLSLRADACDHVGAIRASAGPHLPAPRAYDPRWGSPAWDGERGPAHELLDVLCRLSHQDPERVWNLLPAVAAPLLWCGFLFAGGVFFRRPVSALAAALAALAAYVSGPGNGSFMSSGYPHLFALVPFWTAVGLYVDNLQRPHLPEVFLFALAAFAAWETHASVGIVLTVVLVLAAVRCFTSVDRLQEGLPLLLALWVPAGILIGVHLAVRAVGPGGIDPYRVPATGLLVFDADRRILYAGPGSAFAAGLWMLGGAGLLVLLGTSLRRASSFYLVVVGAGIAVAGFVPFVTPAVTRALGAHVHAWPAVLPVGFAAVAAVEWAAVGLARSEGKPLLRILVAAGALTVAALGAVALFARFPYTPRDMGALRTAPPGEWTELAAAVRDTLPPGTEILADPRTAAYLAAAAPVRPVYWPDVPWDAGEARRRYAAAGAALRPPEGPADTLLGAWPSLEMFQRAFPTGAIVTNRLEPGADGAVERAFARRRMSTIELGDQGMAAWLEPPGPGPEVGQEASPPRCAGLRGLPESGAADTSRVTLVWETVGSAESALGCRLRVELDRVPAPREGIGALPSRLIAAMRRAVAGERADWVLEEPLAQPGTAVPRETLVRLPRTGLRPGVYVVRAAAYSGVRDPNHTAPHARLLSHAPVLGTLRVP